jgi:hyperosmotically inducible protein
LFIAATVPASISGESDMWTRILAPALLTLALAGSAAAQQTDLQIFRNVQRQVLSYPHFTVFDSVHVRIDEGTLTLSGKVTMPFKRSDLEQRVRKVKGIQKVDNRLDVLPASKFDDELRNGIANAIYGNSAFVNYANQVNPPIHIVVERGRVTLEGVVANRLDRQLAYSIAAMFPAFAVKNELRTEEEVREELKKL